MFGALLRNKNGYLFHTKNTTPLSFLKKITVRNSSVGVVDSGILINQPCVMFMCNLHSSLYCPAETMSVNGRWAITYGGWSAGNSTKYDLDIYVFTLIYPHPLPKNKYGMAIWDERGNCILTNETRPLCDLHSVAIAEGKSKTLIGKWAVVPFLSGYIDCKIYIGPGDYQWKTIDLCYAAKYFNGQTVIAPGIEMESLPGEPVIFKHYDVNSVFIRVDEYD